MGARPDRTDLIVSLAFATFGLVEIWLTPTPGLSAERAGESVGLVLISGCFAFRRTLPVSSALAVLLLLLGVGVLWTDSRLWEIAAVLLVCYSGARYATRSGAWVVLLASTVGGIVATAAEDNDNVWQFLGNYLFYIGLFLVVPWTAGLALRRRQQLGRHDAERAVVEERARIARELHDVVGHALGMIVVQAEGERAQLGPDAPESTRETLATIADGARDALDDVRRLLMIMRAENELGPQPGLRDVPRLLDGLCSAGLPVELSVSGASRQLPAGIDLSAYRVVQEALTNVLRHSRGAHARVLLRYDPDAIAIDVTDDGHALPGDGSRGFGLLGMRERVALFGGSVEAGPRADGGFGVHVHLPTRGGADDDLARARV